MDALTKALGRTPTTDEREWFDERAAIRIYDAGQSVDDAEHGAANDVARRVMPQGVLF